MPEFEKVCQNPSHEGAVRRLLSTEAFHGERLHAQAVGPVVDDAESSVRDPPLLEQGGLRSQGHSDDGGVSSQRTDLGLRLETRPSGLGVHPAVPNLTARLLARASRRLQKPPPPNRVEFWDDVQRFVLAEGRGGVPRKIVVRNDDVSRPKIGVQGAGGGEPQRDPDPKAFKGEHMRVMRDPVGGKVPLLSVTAQEDNLRKRSDVDLPSRRLDLRGGRERVDPRAEIPPIEEGAPSK
jgi:hypothetical protein